MVRLMSKQIKHGQDWPDGSIIENQGERFEIIRNFGEFGSVRPLKQRLAAPMLYWTTAGKKAVLISTPKEVRKDRD